MDKMNTCTMATQCFHYSNLAPSKSDDVLLINLTFKKKIMVSQIINMSCVEKKNESLSFRKCVKNILH